MPKTLADMTPEERDQCVGMWCEAGGRLWVVRSVYGVISGIHCRLINPVTDTVAIFTPGNLVTPRFDLTRAWNADGTPLPGQWSYANDVLGEFGNIPEGEVQEFLDDGDASFKRRWVGEWEDMPSDPRP